MAEVTETQLPGVGVRYEFRTSDRDHVGVVHHHSGRREIVVYDRKDPDVARSVLELDPDDSRTLSDLLGASQVTEALEVGSSGSRGSPSSGSRSTRSRRWRTTASVTASCAPAPEHRWSQ